MSKKSRKEEWESYLRETLEKVESILDELGFVLDKEQPHTLGERYLMQAVTTTGGRKLILLGEQKESLLRVVIKVTDEESGKKELRDERSFRKLLGDIDFAASAFSSPKEILFEERNEYLFSIQEFIEQDSTFLERTPEEKFFFALNAFKAQEGAHAATYGHLKTIRKAYSVFSSEDYLQNFLRFNDTVKDGGSLKTLKEAFSLLKDNRETIDQYCGFLVHTDFVPHNFRIRNNKLYLLDHSSLRFGNKYEGWARFLNFMALYDNVLERQLVGYVQNNRTEEEHLALKLMRMYRLGEIIAYYTNTLERSTDNLLKLNEARVGFWTDVLRAILNDSFVEKHIVDTYTKIRGTLRSDDEKQRQEGLH